MKKQPNKKMFTNNKWKHYPTLKVNISVPSNGQNIAINSKVDVTALPVGGRKRGPYTVNFYESGNFLGNKSSAPYTAPWTASANGDYSFLAVATASAGDTVISEPVNVHVYTPIPPPEYGFTTGVISNPMHRIGVAVSPAEGVTCTSTLNYFTARAYNIVDPLNTYWDHWVLPTGWWYQGGTNQYSQTIFFSANSSTIKTIFAHFK